MGTWRTRHPSLELEATGRAKIRWASPKLYRSHFDQLLRTDLFQYDADCKFYNYSSYLFKINTMQLITTDSRNPNKLKEKILIRIKFVN